MSFTLARDTLIRLKEELEEVTQGKRNFEDTAIICKVAISLIDNIKQLQCQTVVDAGMKRVSSKEQYEDLMKYSHMNCSRQLVSDIIKTDRYTFTDVAEDPPTDSTRIIKTIFILQPPG